MFVYNILIEENTSSTQHMCDLCTKH